MCGLCIFIFDVGVVSSSQGLPSVISKCLGLGRYRLGRLVFLGSDLDQEALAEASQFLGPTKASWSEWVGVGELNAAFRLGMIKSN